MPDHVAELHEKIERLQRELQALTTKPPHEELLKIIHRSGWTTPAEAALTQALVDGMLRQVASLRQTQEDLLDGARQVGAAPART
jgi:hypothetical protein